MVRAHENLDYSCNLFWEIFYRSTGSPVNVTKSSIAPIAVISYANPVGKNSFPHLVITISLSNV